MLDKGAAKMKDYLLMFLMLCMMLMIAMGIKQVQTQIELYAIIKKQNELYLSTYKVPSNQFRNDYNRLRIGIMSGDIFPVRGKGDFYKCVIVDTN
jgi:hypothetical protein